jgi:hypothetical protein
VVDGCGLCRLEIDVESICCNLQVASLAVGAIKRDPLVFPG